MNGMERTIEERAQHYANTCGERVVVYNYTDRGGTARSFYMIANIFDNSEAKEKYQEITRVDPTSR
jgi:hypothetical protein